MRYLLFLMCVAAAIQTQAAIVVSVDLDRNTAGIESSLAAVNGQTIEAAIIIDVTNVVTNVNLDTTLSSYGFALRFRTDEFDLVGADGNRNDLGIPTFGLAPLNGAGSRVTTENTTLVDPTVGTYGHFDQIEAVNFVGFAPVGTYTVFEFDLTATNPTGDASTTDILPVVATAFHGFGNDLSQPITALFNGASITAVPEPSSLAFMALGTLMVGHRRRRKRLAAKPV